MKLRSVVVLLCCLSAGHLVAAESSHKIKTVKGHPKGLSEKVAARIHETGYQITGPDGVVGIIWPAKEIPVKAKFKPTLSVAYPFANGELLGAVHFPKGTMGLDFRAQEIAAGVYTLRYGQQPEDGNHLGTSDIRDFCLALPAAKDKDPKPIADEMRRNESSAEAAGSTHPAIFLMSAPPKKPEKEAKLIHHEDEDYWILQVPTTSKAKKKTSPITIRIVVVGLGE